jgi:DNA-binding transcriptional ArsR family regulator
MATQPSCRPEDHGSGPWAEVDAEDLSRAADIFRALGDPGRLRILTLLAERERCVTELVEVLQEKISTVSQRLKLLRSERLARSRRLGKHIFYSLADKHIVELIANALDHARESTGRGAKAKRPSKPSRQ